MGPVPIFVYLWEKIGGKESLASDFFEKPVKNRKEVRERRTGADCIYKNTQIALLIFGNYAIISFGDKQVCVSDAQAKTTVCTGKTWCKHEVTQ